MRDKMAISAYVLKIVKNDLFLRLQMKAKEYFESIPIRAATCELKGKMQLDCYFTISN